MYFTRVLYGMPLTTMPVMFWSSFGTTKCAAAAAARRATWVKVESNIFKRTFVDVLEMLVLSPTVWVEDVGLCTCCMRIRGYSFEKIAVA